MDVFAIIDCNNFYVSCERVFNPKLINRPVVVLSNNDGCLIACSNEVKELGIKIGTPYFKFSNQAKKLGVQVLSSNYTLYGDMSERVVRVIGSFDYQMEVYSIDEVFLKLTVPNEQIATQICRTIREQVHKSTGIPVSIGVARTKTLAKVANKIAKQDGRNKNLLSGVACIIDEEPRKYLSDFLVADVWGIGRRYTKMLKANGILTALDFVKCDPDWIKHKMTIQGKLTWHELQNESCLGLTENVPASKSIASTRLFGKTLSEFEHLSQAVATHTTRIGLKLRQQKLLTGVLYVFVMTNRFGPKYYYKGVPVSFEPTDYTPALINNALKALKKIFVADLEYRKAGVIAIQTQSADSLIAQDLFSEAQQNPQQKLKQVIAMSKIDTLNKHYGRHTIITASSLATTNWQMQSNYRSPRYTTVWQEILTIK